MVYRKEDQLGIVLKMKCATQQKFHRLSGAGYINPFSVTGVKDAFFKYLTPQLKTDNDVKRDFQEG